MYVLNLILMMATVMMSVVFHWETTHHVLMSVAYLMATTQHVLTVRVYQTVTQS